jgi:uncharacterized protein DUF6411
MLIAAVVVVCIALLILAFLFPRLSRHPQRGVTKAFGTGGRTASHAPGPLGRWLAKPFSSSSRAANKSAGAGRRGRGKMPV